MNSGPPRSLHLSSLRWDGLHLALGLSVVMLSTRALASEATPLDVAPSDFEELSGGHTTVFDATRNAFSLPVRNLSEEHRAAFFVGNSFFNQNWIVAPASPAGRDGLGPLFNARSCSACHFKDGRSQPPEPGVPMTVMLLRASVPGRGPHGEPVPDPIYGGQIQGQAIPGVAPEADAVVSYEEQPGQFVDGEKYSLRKPTYTLRNFGYGLAATNLLLSPRVAPAMIGVGLLEAVPEETIYALADPDDRNGDGISGRVNVVWDQVAEKKALGRFGWKAEQPTVHQQSATAFVQDIGITSSFHPAENNTASQVIHTKQPAQHTPEVSDKILGDVVAYSCLLGVPARRKVSDSVVQRGQRLFSEAGCVKCHLPVLKTASSWKFPELAGQIIRPYTDLLLHDMGDALSDHRPSFEAEGREWRTPPLWGIGLVEKVNGHTSFLHDGRARNFSEAILWHDGEAKASGETFRTMPRMDREALLEFLKSL